MADITYGVSYYTSIDGSLGRASGLTVKLIKPGASWGVENGSTIFDLDEIGETGHYENESVPEGYYEIWDDHDDVGGTGADSGQRAIVGQIQTAAIADDAITHAKLSDDAVEDNNIKDGEVTHAKIADDAVEDNNIKDGEVTEVKLEQDVQDKLAIITEE